ncbi:MAG TPA: hypothetical protein VGB63_06880 [Pedobacter sp.]|jgi:hypothetical protein
MKYLAYICFFLVSCDISAKLQIANRSKSTVQYRSTTELERDSNKVINIEISAFKKANLLFGFGQFWTDQRIEKYAQSSKRIDFITVKDTFTVSGQHEIGKFLKDKRKGIFNQTLKIVIK